MIRGIVGDVVDVGEGLAVDATVVEDLVKTYGRTGALDGVLLTVAEGSKLGLLGPNCAGKTTAVPALSTCLRPDSGSARVLGIDAIHGPARLRRIIALAGQSAAVDDKLTRWGDRRLLGRLHRLEEKA